MDPRSDRPPNSDPDELRDFIDDMTARQRNLVFPDTTRNAGIFYRALPKAADSDSRMIQIGVWLVLLMFIVPGVWMLITTLRQRPLAIVILAIILLIGVVADRVIRRRYLK